MEKKSNKGLFVVIGVLIFLVLLLVVLVGVLAWKSLSGSKKDGNNSQIAVTSTEKDDEFGEALETESDDEFDTFSAEMKYVIGGYEFTVPGEYDMFYNEMIGPVVYMDDVFQMKTAVVETSYEEVMKDPASLTEKSVEAGGEILQDIKESEVNGKKYAYFRVDLSGEECFVVYTATPDNKKRIGAQIAIEKDGLSDEDMLQVFSTIAGSAVETNKADSTYDDIDAQLAERTKSEIYGEAKEESTLKFGGKEVTFRVPEGFYSEDAYEGSDYMTERFCTADPRMETQCYFYESEWFDGVKGYLEASITLDDTKIESMEIEGKTIYYIIEKYMHDDSEVQRLYAGCDLGEKNFYVIDALVIDEDIDLSMETIREFLLVSE